MDGADCGSSHRAAEVVWLGSRAGGAGVGFRSAEPLDRVTRARSGRDGPREEAPSPGQALASAGYGRLWPQGGPICRTTRNCTCHQCPYYITAHGLHRGRPTLALEKFWHKYPLGAAAPTPYHTDHTIHHLHTIHGRRHRHARTQQQQQQPRRPRTRPARVRPPHAHPRGYGERGVPLARHPQRAPPVRVRRPHARGPALQRLLRREPRRPRRARDPARLAQRQPRQQRAQLARAPSRVPPPRRRRVCIRRAGSGVASESAGPRRA